MNARNWSYEPDGKTFRYGRVIVVPDPTRERPHNIKVYVTPFPYPEDPGPRSDWTLLEMPEIAFLGTAVSVVQRKEFPENDHDDRIRLDLHAAIDESFEKVLQASKANYKWAVLGGDCDLYAAIWDTFIRDRQLRGWQS